LASWEIKVLEHSKVGSSEVLLSGPSCHLPVLWHSTHHAALAVQVQRDVQSSSGFLTMPLLCLISLF